MAKSVFFILTFLICFPTIANVRSELKRFTLLHDRYLVDRYLRSETESYLIYLDTAVSSGVKKIVSDIKDSAETEQDPVQRQLKTLQVLTRNLNTEKYIDIDVGLGFPLPLFKIRQFEFKTSPFVQANLGASFSFNNQNESSLAVAQTYIRKELKLGIKSKIKKRKDETLIFNVYQLTRSDVFASMDQADIVNQGKLVDFGTLDQDNVYIAADIGYQREFDNYQYRFEVKEIPFMETVSIPGTPRYTKTPLFHYHYRRKNLSYELLGIEPFFGAHYRSDYSVVQGLYLGGLFHFSNLPFTLASKLSNHFLTLNPLFRAKYFQFNYSLKIPHRNPQDDMWTASIHSLNIAVPLP